MSWLGEGEVSLCEVRVKGDKKTGALAPAGVNEAALKWTGTTPFARREPRLSLLELVRQGGKELLFGAD